MRSRMLSSLYWPQPTGHSMRAKDRVNGTHHMNASGIPTRDELDAKAAATLQANVAVSSLYAVQQVIQRGTSEAIAAALGELASRASRRDREALRVVDDWIAASPRLAEIFQCRPDDAVLRMFIVLLNRMDDAREVWQRVAREWRAMAGKARAIEVLDAGVRKVKAPAARTAASWLTQADVDKYRQACLRLLTGVLRHGDDDARAAVLGFVPLRTKNGLAQDPSERSAALLAALTACLASGARKACVQVVATKDALACVRTLASRKETRREAVALLRRLVMDETWLERARRCDVRAGHVDAVGALDMGDDEQRDLLLAAIATAPPLLAGWLAAGASNALSSPPWAHREPHDFGGVQTLAAALACPRDAKVGRWESPREILGTCLPPETALSKKDLTRGLLHVNDDARRATLELLLAILDRYGAEVRGFFDTSDDWEESDDIVAKLALALEHSLTPLGTTKEDDKLVTRLLKDVKDPEIKRSKEVRRETRLLLRSRLPDVQTLLNVVNQREQASLALAAVRRYCGAVPKALVEANWDPLKALVTGHADLRDQIAGIARVHPNDQKERLRKPHANDKTALRLRSLLAEMIMVSKPARALLDDALAPLANSDRERRLWLEELKEDSTQAFFAVVERANKLASLPARAFSTDNKPKFIAAVRTGVPPRRDDFKDDLDDDPTRVGLVSPLVCAALLLTKDDAAVAALVTRLVVRLVHASRRDDLGPLCCAVAFLVPSKASLKAFARAVDADLRSQPPMDDDDVSNEAAAALEGSLSALELEALLATRVGTPLLAPSSRRDAVLSSLSLDDSLPKLKEAMLELPFAAVVAHVCAPFGSSRVVGTAWGAAVVDKATQKLIATATTKDECIDGLRAASFGAYRCRHAPAALARVLDSQRELAKFILSRSAAVAPDLDLDLFYDDSDARTPLEVLKRAPRDLDCPRARDHAERLTMAALRDDAITVAHLAPYVSNAAVRASLESAAQNDRRDVVITILEAREPNRRRDGGCLTRALVHLWLKQESIVRSLDAAVVPPSRIAILRIVRDDGGDLLDRCWRQAVSAPGTTRVMAAQALAVSLVAADNKARARLREQLSVVLPEKQVFAFLAPIRELAALDACDERHVWVSTTLAQIASMEVRAALLGVPPYVASSSCLCECAYRVAAAQQAGAVMAAAAEMTEIPVREDRGELDEDACAVIRWALLWIAAVDRGSASSAAAALFRWMPAALILKVGAADQLDHRVAPVDVAAVARLGERIDDSSGRVLAAIVRQSTSVDELRHLLEDKLVEAVSTIPGVALRLLDALECKSRGALEAALRAYTASVTSTDRVCLRILKRAELAAEDPSLVAWAGGSTEDTGEWIFDALEEHRVRATVSRFPLGRAVRDGAPDDMDRDDDVVVDLPDDDDDDEDRFELPLDEGDPERQEVDEEDEDEGDDGREENEEYDNEEGEEDELDDVEAEDGESDLEDEADETEWRGLVYDPRFVLPACYRGLGATGDEDEDARLCRKAFESGAVGIAVAALSSKRSETRAVAAAVVGRFARGLSTEAAAVDRGFVARPFVRTLLDATFAALKEASDPLRGPRRISCLWTSVVARCLEALKSPAHPGFGVAAAHAVRRAVARPWSDAPLVRDAFLNDMGIKNYADEDAVDKVKARFWAFSCLVDGIRDDHDARAVRRARGLLLGMARVEDLITGGVTTEGVKEGEKFRFVPGPGMTTSGAAKLLVNEENDPTAATKLKRIDVLRRAEADASHRVVAAMARSRGGKRLLVTQNVQGWLVLRIMMSHRPRDIELAGALLHFATDNAETYFTEDRHPLLFTSHDWTSESVSMVFYSYYSVAKARLTRKEDPVEDDLDEFLTTPFESVGGIFGELHEQREDRDEVLYACTRFFFRRYLQTRDLVLAKSTRIGGHYNRLLHIEEAWRICKVAVFDAFREELSLRAAAARVIGGDAPHGLVAVIAPVLAVYFSQQLVIVKKIDDEFGNRLYSPILELLVALLVARLRGSFGGVLVSVRRQLVATLNVAVRVARVYDQGKPAVDLLVVARLELGPGFGYAGHEPASSIARCPTHRIHDLGRRARELAAADQRGPRNAMACAIDVVLADAVHENDDTLLIPADIATKLADDDLLHGHEQGYEAAHDTALSRIEQRARTLASTLPAGLDFRAALARIVADHVLPSEDSVDLFAATEHFCDDCSGKTSFFDDIINEDDENKVRWWKVDIDADS